MGCQKKDVCIVPMQKDADLWKKVGAVGRLRGGSGGCGWRTNGGGQSLNIKQLDASIEEWKDRDDKTERKRVVAV